LEDKGPPKDLEGIADFFKNSDEHHPVTHFLKAIFVCSSLPVPSLNYAVLCKWGPFVLPLFFDERKWEGDISFLLLMGPRFVEAGRRKLVGGKSNKKAMRIGGKVSAGWKDVGAWEKNFETK
jgi:hypothetical protein